MAFFLADAEGYARTRGKQRIFVYVVTNENIVSQNDGYNSIVDVHSRQWRIHNILIQLLQHYPPCLGYSIMPRSALHELPYVDPDVYPPLYSPAFNPPMRYRDVLQNLSSRDFVGSEASIQGLRYFERWRTAQGLSTKPIVAITLRRYGYNQERNSNLNAWSAFAHWVRRIGFYPVFVPDSDTCWDELSELRGETFFREPCWNLGLRIALNEAAFVNFFYSNGTAAIAVLSRKTRYVVFLPIIEGSQQANSCSYEFMGLDTTVNRFPFSLEHQLISWTPDDLEHIQAAFLRVAELDIDGFRRDQLTAPII
jgi:hypothetical protein